MSNLTFSPNELQNLKAENLRLQKELKQWQVKAGHFASLANFATNEALTHHRHGMSSNVYDRLNEILDEVIPWLDYDERE